MNSFLSSVSRVFKGALHASARYPASMFSALILAATASYRIHIDYSRVNDKMLNSLQFTLVLTAFLGMAAAVAVLRRKGVSLLFWLINLAVMLLGSGLFLLIWLQPGDIPEITFIRIIAASVISVLAYLLLVSWKTQQLDFSQAIFMTLKSAMISAIYALAIMLGLFFVAFAVESLIYTALSSDVYGHIAIWSALAWFSFFLGYFPSFGTEQNTAEIEQSRKVPRFIEILFAYVLIPLMAILSIVLFIWVIQILTIGSWPSFAQLSVIFSTYALFGIWLSLMVSQVTIGTTRWFRRFFPFAAWLFLAFVSYALIMQIQDHGLKTSEYFMVLIIIFAAVSSLFLLLLSVVRHRLIGYLAIGFITFIVMPLTGFTDLPAAAQASRLQAVLEENSMLTGQQIQQAGQTLAEDDKQTITDATFFLLQNDDARRPAWFTRSISSTEQFQAVYGFDAVYPSFEPIVEPTRQSVFLMLPAGQLELDEYQIAFHIQQDMKDEPGQDPFIIEGRQGTYTVQLTGYLSGENPAIRIERDGELLFDTDLSSHFNQLADKYELHDPWSGTAVDFEDMLYTLESDQVKILIVFGSIEITNETASQQRYFYTANSIYLFES